MSRKYKVVEVTTEIDGVKFTRWRIKVRILFWWFWYRELTRTKYSSIPIVSMPYYHTIDGAEHTIKLKTRIIKRKYKTQSVWDNSGNKISL